MVAKCLFNMGDILYHNIGGITEGLGVKHLRADMTMEAHKLDIRLCQGVGNILFCLARFNGRTELTIDLTCRNVFVSMGVDTGGQTE